MNDAFLLDTCAIVWLANDIRIGRAAEEFIDNIEPDSQRLFISTISAWEIGMLISRGRIPATKGALNWFEDFVARCRGVVCQPSAAIMIAASYLPAMSHKDPMDRILIATAREHELTIITRDRAILAYGAAGHVKTLAC